MKNYFTIKELTHSDTADKYGIDNTPSSEELIHLVELTYNLLNQIREAWGKPILVSSGYRSKELNKKVGGVNNSAHLTGYAADIIPKKGNIRNFIKFVQNYVQNSGLKFDQCINEYNRWCHIGYKSSQGRQRQQVFDII